MVALNIEAVAGLFARLVDQCIHQGRQNSSLVPLYIIPCICLMHRLTVVLNSEIRYFQTEEPACQLQVATCT